MFVFSFIDSLIDFLQQQWMATEVAAQTEKKKKFDTSVRKSS